MAASQASSMHMFALPPPALPEPLVVDNSSNIAAAATAPTTAPRGKKRRASSQQKPQQQQPPVTLPPPPTRTRKIIQMKPTTPSSASSPPISPSTSRLPTTRPKPTPKTTTTTPPSSTTNATTSRKVARKTAHSLIERRRRSKMNAEFESLKNLVPACRGVEMHKLAILQASIEYVRYLEGCVNELQKATGGGKCCYPPPVFSPRNDDDEGESEDGDGDGDGDEEDVEMKEPLLHQQPQYYGGLLELYYRPFIGRECGFGFYTRAFGDHESNIYTSRRAGAKTSEYISDAVSAASSTAVYGGYGRGVAVTC
ncbi:hypothetical protein BDD12DRAFT_890139 [Trichophaea hybrida]|nr:hypothetical protein BDD12DRAFT_890139 [Trichophaea hybrida]